MPDIVRTWRADRWRARVTAATEKLAVIANGQVLGGPFSGMQYVARAHSSQLGPKLLGTYELELFETLASFVKRKGTRIIDVGAAEGYYAVGLLLLAPDATCIAFEASDEACRDLKELARKNGVTERLELAGFATPSLLEEALRDAQVSTVIVDVDGAELELVNPDLVPSLRRAHVIIEIHPHLLPDVQKQLEARLIASHTLRFLPALDRVGARVPSVTGLTRNELRALMWEARPDGQGWIIGVPKN